MNEDFMSLKDFPAAMARIESFFYVDRCLPDQVFKRSFRVYLLTQDGTSLWDFLAILRKMGSPLLYDTIQLNVLHPHPIDWFYKHFGKINGFTFRADISEEDSGAMFRRNPGKQADAVLYHWEVMTAIPSSGAWAIWGERGSEIDVFGLDDQVLAAHLVKECNFGLDAETAIKDVFACQPYRDQKAPKEFVGALIENYGSRAEPEAKLGGKLKYDFELGS